MMSDFTSHLSDASMDALRSLLGQPVSIRANWASVQADEVLVNDIEIACESSAVAIQHEWLETPVCAIDYAGLRADTLEGRGLKDESAVYLASYDLIDSIHVIEAAEADEVIEGPRKGVAERVAFDTALLFDSKGSRGLKLSWARHSLTFQRYTNSDTLLAARRELRVRTTITQQTTA